MASCVITNIYNVYVLMSDNDLFVLSEAKVCIIQSVPKALRSATHRP